MSKKRHRQPDATGHLSDGCTESGDESNTEEKCKHISGAINISRVKKHIKKSGIVMECPSCKKNNLNDSANNEDEIKINNFSLWICLQCGHQGCGRTEEKHALQHYETPHSDCHSVAMDIFGKVLWCYKCDKTLIVDHRKEAVVDLIQKKIAALTSDQSKLPVIPLQNDKIIIDKEKEKLLCNLPKVRGLRNLGNTCFFNAVLQCLAKTPFLIKVLEDLGVPGRACVLPGGKFKPTDDAEEIELPPIEGILEGCGDFTSILCKTLREMQENNGYQTYTPTELLTSFRKKTIQCMDGAQHDAHELLRHLLEIVRNEDLRKYQSVILKEVGLSEKTKPDYVESSLKSRVKFYGNQASARLLGPEPIFRGVLVSTIECMECHHSSQCTEPFLDLSLPVIVDKPQSPILKRKNSVEDTFQKIKELRERKNVKKYAKNRNQEGHRNNELQVNLNDSVEGNCSLLENEGNYADVEDNIEVESTRPEINEPRYNIEEISFIASPVSPVDHTNQKMLSCENVRLYDLVDAQIGGSRFCEKTTQQFYNNSLNAFSLPDAMDELKTENLQYSSKADIAESSGNLENENGGQSEFSISTSLVVNSNMTSPEASTVSPSSSSIASKESPTSPSFNVLHEDGAEYVERPVSRLGLAEVVTYKNKENFVNCTLELKKDFSKLMIDSRDEKFDPLPTEESVENINSIEESCGDTNVVTSGLPRLDIANNMYQSPSRYSTKEGECSIQSCLNQFTALELMSGSNNVACEACTERERKEKDNATKMVCTPSTKQYLISQVPAVLILYLKRCQGQRVNFRKVSKHVTFTPLLDLSPICKKSRKPKLYALYGVVVHSGTLHAGHYVAYVKTRHPVSPDDSRWSFLPAKNAKDTEETSDSSSDSEGEDVTSASEKTSDIEVPPGRWYYVSDSSVSEVDESTVLESQAYLLFYERIL